MKLTYNQAWAVVRIILFPLFVIKTMCILFVVPIIAYDKALDYLGGGFRLWLQGRKGKEWYG